MAHWISSKLKAAETLLHQIDQQAAESLRKNEKLLSDDQLGVEDSPRTPETKPLIKDQLKKKAPENVASQSITSTDKRSLNVMSRSNSDINREKEAGVSQNSISKSNSSSGLTESDWTELLSVPDKNGVSRGRSASQSSNGVSRRVSKKPGKKLGNTGPASNLSVSDRSSNRVLKSSTKLSLGKHTGADNDEKASSGDATPRTSSGKSPSSGGELDQIDCSPTHVIGNRNMSSIGRVEGANEIVDGEKLFTLDDSDHSLAKMRVSREGNLDMNVGVAEDERVVRGMQNSNVGLNDGKKLRREMSRNTGSKVGSRISNSMSNVSSLRSDGEPNSETDTTSSSDSGSETEREERRKRRQQILAERAAAKAVEAIKERENLVAKLEGEKQSLEKILEERAKQQVQEASELQTTMMETMEAVDLEKQKHNSTRMEALARIAKLESANADLARSLANVQKNLELEVDHIAELRQQVHMKEAIHEELTRKISSLQQSDNKSQASKGAEFELEMLEAEYSFIAEKVGRMQNQANTLETSIETTQRELESPTEVEIELKRRLGQLTDHLIQKQAQVETLSSEKAMLLLKIEAVSRLLDEHKLMTDSSGLPRDDVESGMWQLSNSKLRPLFKERMQSGKRHLGSLVRQLDSLFCAGAVFLRRNSRARIWSLVYFVCLHLWVIYILMSHSSVSDDRRSGAVISLENINNTGGV